MKKIFIVFLALFLVQPLAFGAKKQTQKPDEKQINTEEQSAVLPEDETPFIGSISINAEKKDPKLIYIPQPVKFDNKLYQQKAAADNAEYAKNKAKLTSEQYKIYRIAEKIIRANNLDYQNWRIGFNISAEDVNATASAGNLISLYSSLYDSFNENDDALAFIISHELGHFLLGHHQLSAEKYYKIRQLEVQSATLRANANEQRQLGQINDFYGNNSASMVNNISSIGSTLSSTLIEKTINELYKQAQAYEFEADSEAVVLMTRAGYNAESAFETFNLFLNLPSIYTTKSTHPPVQQRMSNLSKEISEANKQDLINQGKKNISESNVLLCTKSMDKKTFIISKPVNSKKAPYKSNTKDVKYLRLGYIEYKNNNISKAIEHFRNASIYNPSDYVAPLYLSYSYEYLYNQHKNKEYLKHAYRWIKRASSANPLDQNVISQISALKELK